MCVCVCVCVCLSSWSCSCCAWSSFCPSRPAMLAWLRCRATVILRMRNARRFCSCITAGPIRAPTAQIAVSAWIGCVEKAARLKNVDTTLASGPGTCGAKGSSELGTTQRLELCYDPTARQSSLQGLTRPTGACWLSSCSWLALASEKESQASAGH